MQSYQLENLLVRSGSAADPQVLVEVTPQTAGWDTIYFQARRLGRGETWTFETAQHELALVALGGVFEVQSNRGRWQDIGRRHDVFSGLPHALYLPVQTSFTVTATSDCEFAAAWVATDQEYAPKLITPAQVTVEIRGGDNATRQINSIIPPGFPCARLVVVEVYTPSGNWSSYPPHKHDVEAPPEELPAEEIYSFYIDPPNGFGYQRLYTAPDDPEPFSELFMVQNGDTVVIPRGYHPVVVAPGYQMVTIWALSADNRVFGAWRRDPYYGELSPER